MSSEHDTESRVADALSRYIDALSTEAPPHVDDFLKAHQDLARELRPLLLAAYATKRAASSVRVPARDASPVARRMGVVKDFQKAKTRLGVERGTAAVPIDKRPDVLLLLLRVTGEIWGKTRLQKLLLLVAKETSIPSIVPEFYQHYAYNFGPFDHLVHHDVAQLCAAGVVRVEAPPASGSHERTVDAVFQLTARGRQFADALGRTPEGQSVTGQLRQLADKYGRMPLEDLVRHVYKTYPELTTKSKIRGKVLGEDADDK